MPLRIGAGSVNGVYAFRQHERIPANGYISRTFGHVVFNTSFGGVSPSQSAHLSPNANPIRGYNQSLAAVGGTAPYSWSILSGTLPSL